MDEYIWIIPKNANFDVPIGARILGVFGTRIKIKDDDNNESWITKDEILRSMHPTSIFGVDDMTHLGDLQEYSILRNIQLRYTKDVIYTYIGPILVAVNPYKALSIYDKSKMLQYRKKRFGELPPHIYAVADDSYEGMAKNFNNRCIVVSGESGAGKTESTKLFLQYFAQISNKRSYIEQQILDSNPILEGFGNAKTLNNDNSSRFGKYIVINFSRDGSIYSAEIKQYLLEKSRIVSQSQNEQNYHIFYAMLSGMTVNEKQCLGLKMSSYNYLNWLQNVPNDKTINVSNIGIIKSAMRVLNFPDSEIWSIFELLASILHFGNLEYEKISVSNMEAVQIASDKEIEYISKLLRISKQQLIKALTKKTISTHGDNVSRLLSKQQAIDSRDAFVKKIYENLFNYIVNKINQILFKNEKFSVCYIGILDIFGFEVFDRNSFEQLCINYANEKLQQFFINHVFKSEQEQYAIEGINWKFIDYSDNKDVLDLFEFGVTSVLSIINDELKFPKGTNQTMLDKLINSHSENSIFFKPKYKNVEVFGIKHFAGVVLYDVKDFLEKNHDACNLDMKEILESSSNSFLKNIFADDFDENFNGKKKPVTIISKFKNSLDLLMNELNQCQPFFVRCIKPNNFKKPQKFDRLLCCQQLRYSGMTETTKIREAGYSIRYDYIQFVQRFGVICSEIPLAHKTDCKEATIRICKTVFRNSPKADYKLGLSKIFLKQYEELLLEKERDKALSSYVITMQKMVKGWLERRRFIKLKKIVLLLENRWMEKQRFSKSSRILKSNKLTSGFNIRYYRYLITQLQAYCRGYLVRREIKKKLEKKKSKKAIEDSKNDSSDTFQKFAKKYFQEKQNHHFTKKPIKNSLTLLVQPIDTVAAKALWITILRYTGNIQQPKKNYKKAPIEAQIREIVRRIKNEEEDFVSNSNKQTSSKVSGKTEQLYKIWLKSYSSSLHKLQFIVAHGIQRPQLRDEIYCQICKIITKNPSQKAKDCAWELLSSCTGCFPPTDLFIKCLKDFIREGPKKYISYCLFRLHRTIQNGSRSQPPSHTEFQAITEQKPVQLELHLMNGSKTLAKIDSATTARELLDIVAKNIKLVDTFGFSIVLAHEMKYLSLGDGSDFVLDSVSECEQYALEIGDSLINTPWKLFLKKEMFAPWHHCITDEVSAALICHQIKEGIKTQEYECESSELCRLIAQLFYTERGIQSSGSDLKSLYHSVPEYIKSGTSAEEMEQIKNTVVQNYDKMLAGHYKPVNTVREDIIKYAIKKWPLHFSKFFNVFGSIRNTKSSFSYPEVPLLIAVNSSGIIVIDESSEKRIIAEIVFTEIREITRKEAAEGKGYILNIVSHTGMIVSLVFQSVFHVSLHELLIKIMENLKKFSKFVISIKHYKTLDKSFLELQKGDLIKLSPKFSGKNLIENSWAEGLNTRNGEFGNILYECVEIIPTMEKPSELILKAMNDAFPFGKINHLCPNAERLKHYTLESYAAQNFRKEVFRNKSAELWKYSREKIQQPLHANLLNDKRLSNEAVRTFEVVLEFMGEKENKVSSSNLEFFQKIFGPPLQYESLRDEIYCQIMKQLTSNPDRESENRLWELMWMITGLFTCTDILAKEVKKFLQSRRTIQTARECLMRFHKISQSDSRKHTPHLIEIESIKYRPCQILYKVYFPDGTHKFFQLNSHTKFGDLKEIILNRLKIESNKGFALFVHIVGRLFLLPDDYYVFDYFQLLRQWTEKKNLCKENWQYQIYFMKHTWKDVVPGNDKVTDLKFLYPIEYNKYIEGYYEVDYEDMVYAAALLYRVYTTDEKNQSFQQILQKVVPLKSYNSKKLDVWQKDIQSVKLSLSVDDSKINFLKFLYKLPSYGFPYFKIGSEGTNLSNYIFYPITNSKSLM